MADPPTTPKTGENAAEPGPGSPQKPMKVFATVATAFTSAATTITKGFQSAAAEVGTAMTEVVTEVRKTGVLTTEKQRAREEELASLRRSLRALYNSKLASAQEEWKIPHNLNVTAFTWNVAEKNPTLETNKMLKAAFFAHNTPDIIGIGLQEVDMTAMSMLEFSKTDKHKVWESTIEAALKEKAEYVSVGVQYLTGLMLMVFVRGDHHKQVRNKRLVVSRQGGALGVVGNKGGIACRFSLYTKRFLFISTHLPPHQGGAIKRNQAYHKIFSEIKFPLNIYADDLLDFGKTDGQKEVFETPSTAAAAAPDPAGAAAPESVINAPVVDEGGHASEQSDMDEFHFTNNSNMGAVQNHGLVLPPRHDYIFWFGDLNYRVDRPDAEVRQLLSEKPVKPESIAHLLEYDQLGVNRKGGEVFQGFREAEVKFVPTYKYDFGTDIYDTSPKNRTPSWTDRCLYACPPMDKEIWTELHYHMLDNTFGEGNLKLSAGSSSKRVSMKKAEGKGAENLVNQITLQSPLAPVIGFLPKPQAQLLRKESSSSLRRATSGISNASSESNANRSSLGSPVNTPTTASSGGFSAEARGVARRPRAHIYQSELLRDFFEAEQIEGFESSITPTSYDRFESTLSDHRPVVCEYEVSAAKMNTEKFNACLTSIKAVAKELEDRIEDILKAAHEESWFKSDIHQPNQTKKVATCDRGMEQVEVVSISCTPK